MKEHIAIEFSNFVMTLGLLYMPAQIIQMMVCTQIMAIWTPATTLQDHLKIPLIISLILPTVPHHVHFGSHLAYFFFRLFQWYVTIINMRLISAKQLLLQLISLVLPRACTIPIKLTEPKLHDQGKTLFFLNIS